MSERERERFEAWAKSPAGRYKSCVRFGDDHPKAGEYRDQDTQERWLAWQACWTDALREAADCCDVEAAEARNWNVGAWANGAMTCAARIRALLPQEGK